MCLQTLAVQSCAKQLDSFDMLVFAELFYGIFFGLLGVVDAQLPNLITL